MASPSGRSAASGLRAAFVRPALLNYITGSVIGALLPFAFAYFAFNAAPPVAATSIALIVSFYPAVLNKTVLLGAVWLRSCSLCSGCLSQGAPPALSLLLPTAFSLFCIPVTEAMVGTFPGRSCVFGRANIEYLDPRLR